MVTIIACLMIAAYMVQDGRAQNTILLLSAGLFVLYPLATLF